MEHAIEGAPYYECERSPYTAWAYTVKDNRSETTDYYAFFDRCEQFGCKVVSKFSEHGNHNKLHYHGVIKIPKGFYRKKLMMPGLHLKLKEITDYEGWLEYCKKEQPTDDDHTYDKCGNHTPINCCPNISCKLF